VRALAELLPRLAARIPSVALGDWPTPISAVAVDGRTLWIKDEGASSAIYGGNKIRTLEMWFGHAPERRARRIWAIIGSRVVRRTSPIAALIRNKAVSVGRSAAVK
jgi:1-aminocyclopropane-1-carboxylate deaminase/D-cysteine desulfhydrase-like pyridoxal-dependent ACC family enzyme